MAIDRTVNIFDAYVALGKFMICHSKQQMGHSSNHPL